MYSSTAVKLAKQFVSRRKSLIYMQEIWRRTSFLSSVLREMVFLDSIKNDGRTSYDRDCRNSNTISSKYASRCYSSHIFFCTIRCYRFPIYHLISGHLLPVLHEELDSQARGPSSEDNSAILTGSSLQSRSYHALLTSHHLVSHTKRRSLQSWSSSLSITGFAKVGYPGVIYAQGQQGDVEEFVGNVKAMQWLALRVRFVESLEADLASSAESDQKKWSEFQKIGEVVDEMRRLGRERFVVELGIGSASIK